jgi:hypothetical protein
METYTCITGTISRVDNLYKKFLREYTDFISYLIEVSLFFGNFKSNEAIILKYSAQIQKILLYLQ